MPLFVGANKAAYGATLKKFRKSATPEVVDHVVFYKDASAALPGRPGHAGQGHALLLRAGPGREGLVPHRGPVQ